MKYIVRQATKDDEAAILSVLTEAADWLRSNGMAMWQTDELDQNKMARSIGDFYVAEDLAGTAAGVVKLQIDDDEFWPDVRKSESVFLHRLAVRRAFAGGGLSKVLLNFAVRKAESLGKRFLRLDCAVERPKLRAVYENYGFTYHSDIVVGPFHVARYEYRFKTEPNQALQHNDPSCHVSCLRTPRASRGRG